MTADKEYQAAAVFLLLVLTAVFLAVHCLRRRAEEKRRLERCLEKGRQGETDTAEQIDKLRGYKRIVSNLWIPKNAEGDTCEIDMVLIHQKGIFVIENKNYTGCIYGSEADREWCQVTGGQHYSFYNPIRQNSFHIRHLRHFLTDRLDCMGYGADGTVYDSVITFNGGARLRIRKPSSKDVLVANSARIKRKLGWRLFWRRRVYTRKEVDQIWLILKQQQNPSKKTIRRHARELKKYR